MCMYVSCRWWQRHGTWQAGVVAQLASCYCTQDHMHVIEPAPASRHHLGVVRPEGTVAVRARTRRKMWGFYSYPPHGVCTKPVVTCKCAMRCRFVSRRYRPIDAGSWRVRGTSACCCCLDLGVLLAAFGGCGQMHRHHVCLLTAPRWRTSRVWSRCVFVRSDSCAPCSATNGKRRRFFLEETVKLPNKWDRSITTKAPILSNSNREICFCLI
jgi:hypothetical protein